MVVDKDNNLLELRSYDGEYAHTEFYCYLAAVDAWLSTIRIARKHDTIPVVYSTTQRAYFENQLGRHGFQIENGMIPTPIISYWMNSWNLIQGMDKPRYSKYYNRFDGAKYPDMIPCEALYTISLWSYKREDMFELTSQIRTMFDTGIFWVKFTDPTTKMTQHTPFFWEGMSDVSNMEPGDKDNTLIRRDINLRSNHFLPRGGQDFQIVRRIFIDFGQTKKTIEYISGNIYSGDRKDNDGLLEGSIASGHVYVSGTVNVGKPDEEHVLENWIINPFAQ